jgi:hypothetical protein
MQIRLFNHFFEEFIIWMFQNMILFIYLRFLYNPAKYSKQGINRNKLNKLTNERTNESQFFSWLFINKIFDQLY